MREFFVEKSRKRKGRKETPSRRRQCFSVALQLPHSASLCSSSYLDRRCRNLLRTLEAEGEGEWGPEASLSGARGDAVEGEDDAESPTMSAAAAASPMHSSAGGGRQRQRRWFRQPRRCAQALASRRSGREGLEINSKSLSPAPRSSRMLQEPSPTPTLAAGRKERVKQGVAGLAAFITVRSSCGESIDRPPRGAGDSRSPSFLSVSFPPRLKKGSISLSFSRRAQLASAKRSGKLLRTRERKEKREKDRRGKSKKGRPPCRRRPRLPGAAALPRLLLGLNIIREVPRVVALYRQTAWVSLEIEKRETNGLA